MRRNCAKAPGCSLAKRQRAQTFYGTELTFLTHQKLNYNVYSAAMPHFNSLTKRGNRKTGS